MSGAITDARPNTDDKVTRRLSLPGMDRIWQWAWDRYGARYSWAICAVTFLVALPIYLLLSFVIVGFEGSGHYVEAAVVTVVTVVVLVYGMALPSLGQKRVVEQWAAGHEIDRSRAMDATYAWARGAAARAVVVTAVYAALFAVVVGAIAGATGWRLVQYGILGVGVGIGTLLIALHSFVEAALRPARVAIAGDTGVGDSLPRSRPSFAAWSNVPMLAAAFAFAVGGATEPNALRPGTSANGCRWFRTMTWVRCRRRSTACRPVWPSGNDFRRRSGPMSTPPLRRGCSNRVTTSSPGSAGR